ncbi:hypothetical protein [uncultured Holdemanella sp.]|jgi:hypothetical protein|uniref:hypothetical protein n=1 Tax=uncultured Holdemanella sp. TaxID=1763549 RepID=UPI00258816A1|nr:hypothetical protein [uncultured Holdemanella sp.]
MKVLVLVLLLLTGCIQAQPELRETKEVQTSIPYSDEELIKNANDQIEDEAYYVDSITQQSDTEVWFSLKNKDLNKQYVFKYKGNELIPDRLVD